MERTATVIEVTDKAATKIRQLAEKQGAEPVLRVLVDQKSAPIVEGSTLEFNDVLLGGGLKMLNPRAVHECACGESFSI